MIKYIGFDISCKETVACIIQKNRKDAYDTMPTELKSMQHWLKKQKEDGSEIHLTFEVGGHAGWIYDGLVDIVDKLKVSNPYELTWIYRTRKKSDRIDARKQAVLLTIDEVPEVYMPKKAVRDWRVQILHRKKLVYQAVAMKNQIRALVKSKELKPVESGNWWAQKYRWWFHQLCQSEELWTDGLFDLLEQLELYEVQTKRITERLDKILENHPDSELIMSMPGVGPRTTEAVLAYSDDINRFARGKEFASYFGMTPKLDQSGKVCRNGHISKQGPAVVRWLIVESAWRAVNKCPALQSFYKRVCRDNPKRKKTAIVATARKMLTIMRAMLISRRKYDENYVLNQAQVKNEERQNFYRSA